MTREEAERETAKQSTDAAIMRSTESTRHHEARTVSRTNTDNSVIQMAENQALKTEKRGANEDSIPDRTLTTIRSSSAERNSDRAGMTLPIVDEVGESSSTGGQSERSTHEGDELDERPPTPPKDSERNLAPTVPPKETRSRGPSFDAEKALPPLPRTMSPEEMDGRQSIVV